MYKSRCLALLPLLTFALAAITSEYSDESISVSTSAGIPDSTFEGATKVSNHVWDALDGNQRELLASILKNRPGTPEATPTVDKASADQVGELGRHMHKEHKYMSGKWDDSNEYEEADDDYGKGNEADCGCYHRLTPTYHISLNDEDDKYKTISLPAQGQPFVYGEDERHPLPPLVKSECCQEYCYDPCCQPTADIYVTNPEQKLCGNACDPCGHHDCSGYHHDGACHHEEHPHNCNSEKMIVTHAIADSCGTHYCVSSCLKDPCNKCVEMHHCYAPNTDPCPCKDNCSRECCITHCIVEPTCSCGCGCHPPVYTPSFLNSPEPQLVAAP
ncbi:hypothetical protein J3F81_005505, partial [Coemansia sp. RSA 371]